MTAALLLLYWGLLALVPVPAQTEGHFGPQDNLAIYYRVSQVLRLTGGDCFVAEAPRNDMTKRCLSLRARLAERGNL